MGCESEAGRIIIMSVLLVCVVGIPVGLAAENGDQATPRLLIVLHSPKFHVNVLESFSRIVPN